jgi:hypothetical protein
MLTAEARVETERAGRYLVQLCRHIRLAAQTHPQMQARVEWTDDRGVISVGGGRCTLRADPGVLTLRAEAPDEESLSQLEQRMASRLEQVGRRDHLSVSWTRLQGASEQTPGQPLHPDGSACNVADPPAYPRPGDDAGVGPSSRSTAGASRWLSVVGIVIAIAFVLLIVVAHLTGVIGPGLHGPGGTTPPSPSLTETTVPAGGGR